MLTVNLLKSLYYVRKTVCDFYSNIVPLSCLNNFEKLLQQNIVSLHIIITVCYP